MISAFIIEGVSGLRRKGLATNNQKDLKGVVHKQIVCSNNKNQNQIEVVTYTAINNKCAIGFQTGGFVFSVAPFFPGRGGGWKSPDNGGGSRGGGVSCEEFGVDKGGGGGGFDVVHNQGL